MTRRLPGLRRNPLVAVIMLWLGAATGLSAQEFDLPPSPISQVSPLTDDDRAADAKEETETLDSAETPKDAGDTAAGGSSILDLDIEQLGQIPAKIPTSFDVEVTTVTATESTVGKSPAAVFVITNEMIRRSGATSVPECFRMVPGMQVAKIGPSKWAISSRGFNSEFTQKLLVLVDGRSVYSPFFAGVYWETQDLVLQDIERIEVIRGPGATIWGANAVNGVINIITKTAGDTQGALVSAGGGDQDRTVNSVRFGGKLGENTQYRVYARQFDRAAGYNPLGVNDAWQQTRGGFRIDGANPDENDTFTLQGDIYGGVIGETSNLPAPAFPFFATMSQTSPLGGGNLLGRWTRVVDDENTWSLQAFFDRSERKDVDFDFAINTYDLEFRQFLKHSDTHMFTWGAGYRVTSDDMQGSRPSVSIPPESLVWDQASLFVQEEMPIFRDDVKLIVGSKFMYYYFTGFEYQPSARMLWEIDDTQVLWGALSRAVRTPSRGEDDVRIVLPSPPDPVSVSVIGGGRSLVSEQLLAYEVGYRKQVTKQLSFELAAFFNDYDDLINVVPIGFVPGFPSIIQTQFQNSQDGYSYGAELNWQWEVHEKWRLQGWYSWMNLQLDGAGNLNYDGTTPINQAYLMSSWDLPRKFEADVMARYVDSLPGGNINIPSYTSLDARLGWRPNDAWEFSIIGQNLLEPHHMEFAGLTTVPSAVNRGVFAQVVWRH
jgi:iron complex outermembrane receptor protein